MANGLKQKTIKDSKVLILRIINLGLHFQMQQSMMSIMQLQPLKMHLSRGQQVM